MKTQYPIVMTLDAGGTNLVFSAGRGPEEIVAPVTLPSVTDNLDECLEVIKKGFETVRALLPEPPKAISFAFPGAVVWRSVRFLRTISAFPYSSTTTAVSSPMVRRWQACCLR